ncbi:hypothetical protein GOP47_0023691 [Adiantum capillus-veneris]|uniref:Uncharacterized protein n=1 Tax=Adiantum capillus-veneris TaxID=13818 RepID=A0A9D4U6I5_ADICA|nr:hypothetical protein GOP47_0023691 [Adiantum capillus-veneris]
MGNQHKSNPFCAHNELTMLSASVCVQFCDSDAFITISVPKRPGFWPAFMLLLQNIDFEVLNATLSTTASTSSHHIHAQIPDETDINSDDLQFRFEALILEELDT